MTDWHDTETTLENDCIAKNCIYFTLLIDAITSNIGFSWNNRLMILTELLTDWLPYPKYRDAIASKKSWYEWTKGYRIGNKDEDFIGMEYLKKHLLWNFDSDFW